MVTIQPFYMEFGNLKVYVRPIMNSSGVIIGVDFWTQTWWRCKCTIRNNQLIQLIRTFKTTGNILTEKFQ